MKRIVIFCSLCIPTFYCAGLVQAAVMAPLPPPIASSKIPGVGTNYLVYDLGTYNPDAPTSPTNNWYIPGENFKTPVGLYNLNSQEVNQQIANMRASGMDYITLIIPMSNLSACMASGACNNGFNDWLWGYLIDDSQASLRPQQQSNLISILQYIKAQGFRHVIVRFGNADPRNWPSWQEVEYQKAWNTIASVHNTVDSQLAGGVTTPIFDLGVEAIGDPYGQMQSYVKRLWSDYTYTYGIDDTVGFSTIPDAAHMAGLSWYGSLRPKTYAFDIYNDVGQGLVSAWNALGSEKTKPIIIMETYDNDATTASQLQGVLNTNPAINVVALMQWQNSRLTPTCSGCDVSIAESAIQDLNTTGQMSNYQSIASPVVSDDSNSSLLHLADVNCATTTTSTCTLRGQFGYNSVSGFTNYQIYVSSSSGVRTLWGCSGGSSSVGDANWVQRNFTYRFEYFQVNSCNASITGLTPAAVSFVSVR